MKPEQLEIVMEIEEEFDLEIPDAAADNILTVGDATRYVQLATTQRDSGGGPSSVFSKGRRHEYNGAGTSNIRCSMKHTASSC